MKTAFGSIAFFALGMAAVAASGCEAQDCDVTRETPDGGTQTSQGTCFKSLKRFEAATPESREVSYAAGSNVTIDGRNGNIRVEQGTAGVVKATFLPFVFRAFDTPPEEAANDMSKLNIQADGTTEVVLATTRTADALSSLGADIAVWLPPEFDGMLKIRQDNGSVDVNFAGAATHLGIDSNNGSCEFDAGSAARSVDITCDNGDITGVIPVPADATGGPVTSGNGAIDLTFGTGATPFNVSAQAMDGGAVVTSLGSACTEQAASDSAKTVSCNGATSANPTYTITASGTSLADVNLNF